MIVGIISAILWVGGLIGYIIYNLITKNRKLENIVISQTDFINETVSMLDDFNSLVNQVDSKIWVQSDPEFLQLMENVKTLQIKIQQYTGRK